MNRQSSTQVRHCGFFAALLLLSIPMLASAASHAQPPAATYESAALYAQGMSWDQFLDGAKVNRETWQMNAGREVPAGLTERFRRAGNELRLLVITADWCTDSVHSVPYIAKLAAEAGVALRVVDFKSGRAVMNAHRTPDGRASTPTVILLRGDKQVAAWVERPAALQWWYLGMAGEIAEAERQERKKSWYEWNRGTDALTEIVVLAEQTAAKAPDSN